MFVFGVVVVLIVYSCVVFVFDVTIFSPVLAVLVVVVVVAIIIVVVYHVVLLMLF